MDKKVLIVISALLLALSASATGVKYVLTGKASTDMEGKKVYLIVLGKQKNVVSDSVVVSKGQFVFKGEQDAPSVAMVTSKASNEPAKSVLVVLEQGNIAMDFSADNGKIEGGKLNKCLNVYIDSIAVLTQQKKAVNLDKMLSQYRDSTTSEEQRKETVKLYNHFKDRQGRFIRAIVDQNLNNVVGAFLFANYSSMYSNEESAAILDKAGIEFQNYPMVQTIAKQMAAEKKRGAGNQFMDFEQPDADGTMHKLSEYIGAGKYVLVDFWASWCGPCRAEMPNVKAAYDKYHPKGFEIVSVSLDNKKDAWLDSINKLGMNWNHLSDLQGWKNAAAQQYGVNGIPCTVLIGPDGKIIGGDYRGAELDKKLGELLK